MEPGECIISSRICMFSSKAQWFRFLSSNLQPFCFAATYIVEEVLRFEIDTQYSKLSSGADDHKSMLNGGTNESESVRDKGLLVLHH